MKIAFIYPNLAESGFNVKRTDNLLRYIHHGICSLSACAKEAGFNTDLIELRELSGWDEFANKVQTSGADVAAVTIMSPDYSYALKAMEIIKADGRGMKVIVGGIHPTIRAKDLAVNPNVDYVIKGEGEKAFIDILRNINRRNAIGQKVIQGESLDVNRIPLIDRYLFDCLEYPFDYFLPLPFFTIMAGRGCSYNCKFCAPASKMVFGKGARRRGVDDVLKELGMLQSQYGMKSFMFHDDCFTENKEWVFDFCEKYKDAGFTQDFICQTRADIICKHPDMVKTLARTGLKMVMVGFESGSDRVLKFIGKAVTVKQNLDAARICHANNVRIWALHMYGLPTETNEEAEDTVRMIKEIRPFRSSAAFFTPHPGSYLYDYCKANDLSLIEDNDDFVRCPEEDKPKIKGVDYAFIKTAAVRSKRLPLESRLAIRIDKAFRCRRNRRFLRAFRALRAENPGKHCLDVLEMMNKDRY